MKPFLPSFPVSPIVRVLAILGFFIGCLAGPGARGQGHQHGGWCGTPAPSLESKRAFVEIIKQIEKSRGMAKVAALDVWVPLTFWRVVGTTTPFTDAHINLLLAELNKDFQRVGIKFFLRSSGTVSAPTFFNLKECDYDNLFSRAHDDSSINIYLINRIDKCDGTPTTLGGVCPSLLKLFPSKLVPTPTTTVFNEANTNAIFYTYQNGIMVTKFKKALSHEMGHYFGLLHTHQDNTECNVPDNSIGAISDITPNFGDMIGDTPFDPFGIESTSNSFTVNEANSNCQYVPPSTTVQLCGRSFSSMTPPTRNLMGYWYKPDNTYCAEEFTQKQVERMQTIFPIRATSRSNTTGKEYDFSGPTTFDQPINLATTIVANGYKLTWPTQTRVGGYIIERSTSADFSSYQIIAGLDSAAITYTDTEVNPFTSTPYYYRIRASNSTTYSCPGTVPTALVINSTPLSGAALDSRWWGDYAKKATKWGFMANSQFSVTGTQPTLTAADAANAIVRAAKSLNFTAYQSLAVNCGQTQNPAFYYLQSRGLIPSLLLPTSTITLGQACSLVVAVLLDGNSAPYLTRTRTNSNVAVAQNATYAIALNRVIRTLVLRSAARGNRAEWLFGGPTPFPTVLTVTGNETIGPATLSKLVTGAYEAKYWQINNRTRQARIATTDLAKAGAIGEDPDDYILIGDQNEFETETDGDIPSLSAVGQTVSLTSGQSFTVGVSTNLLNNGQRVYFFWSLDGISQGIQMVPLRADFGQVRIPAPAVSTPQTFHLYVYLAAENGNRGEYYQDIIVSPASTTGTTGGGSSGNLSRMEYFLDDDPGLGLARSVGALGATTKPSIFRLTCWIIRPVCTCLAFAPATRRAVGRTRTAARCSFRRGACRCR